VGVAPLHMPRRPSSRRMVDAQWMGFCTADKAHQCVCWVIVLQRHPQIQSGCCKVTF
jgi:hypothetical protein